MTKIVTEDMVFSGPVTFLGVPKEFLGQFPSGNATPSIKGTRYWWYNGGALAITNFKDSNDVHTLFILGNANLTINNNANIKTNTGANKVLVANKVYTFHKFNGIWYEVV
jgi:hypothetical protein